MKNKRLHGWLARAAILAACLGTAFALGTATKGQTSQGAVPVRAAPPAAKPRVTGLGARVAIPRLRQAPEKPTPTEPTPSEPGPAPPVRSDLPGPTPPPPQDPGPPPPDPNTPNTGDDESSSGTL
jgi:hypothetical protein